MEVPPIRGRRQLLPRTSFSLLAILRVGTLRGLTVQQCLSGTGLREPPAGDLEISPECELTAAANVISLTGSPAQLGLDVGRRATIGSLGVFGFALLSSPTVLDALELACQYSPLAGGFTRTFVERVPHEVRIIFDDNDFPQPLRDFALMRDVGVCLSLNPHILPTSVPAVLHVRLDSQALSRQSAARNIEKIVFNSDRNFVGIPAEWTRHPLPQADPATTEFCRARCRELLERHMQRSGVAAQVRDLMAQDPLRNSSMAHTARELHVNTRTLRRRLDDENTSFRAVRDEFRSVLAVELLARYGLTVEQVALRLGYTEPSSFVRAFVRWHGKSPARYRDESRTLSDAVEPH